MRGQSDLITTIILVGVTIVIGVGFLAFAVPNISRLVSENNAKALLYEEQSNLVIYREVDDSTRLCLGLLRISPSHTVYSIAILDENLNSIDPRDIVYFPTLQVNIPVRLVPPGRVYYIAEGGYYPILGEVRVIDIQSSTVSQYAGEGRPLLMCIDKDKIAGVQAKVFILVSLNNNLYEVGRVYVPS